MINITEAIRSLAPNVSSFAVDEGRIIAWDTAEEPSGVAQPTDQEIQAEVIRLQAEYDSQEYARLRQNDYPNIQDCIHAILDDDLEALQVKRQEVKNRYPKP